MVLFQPCKCCGTPCCNSESYGMAAKLNQRICNNEFIAGDAVSDLSVTGDINISFEVVRGSNALDLIGTNSNPFNAFMYARDNGCGKCNTPIMKLNFDPFAELQLPELETGNSDDESALRYFRRRQFAIYLPNTLDLPFPPQFPAMQVHFQSYQYWKDQRDAVNGRLYVVAMSACSFGGKEIIKPLADDQ